MIAMTDASMKARVRNLARQTGLSPQIVLQMHLLERLLERFSKSRYAGNVVLKGGMLIASMAGIDQRYSKSCTSNLFINLIVIFN